MHGILARGNHTCFVAKEPAAAWRMLREGVVFDLVFIELRLAEGSGLAFLQRLRDDWFWKILPVVVYTAERGSTQVKRALGLNVQNYLIKPYDDELIYAEIAKALRHPWRNRHFEEMASFCALMALTPENLAQMRREVMVEFDQAAQTFPAWAEKRQNQEVFERIAALAAHAESAGIWGGVDFLRHLQEQAALGNWSVFASCHESLEFASRLIFCQLNPSYAPDCMRSEAQRTEAREAAERARWECADVEKNGPVLDASTLAKQVDALAGCPVVDTSAAGFQMVASGRATAMSQVMDLVARDPGLSAQILAAANRSAEDKLSEVEDPRAAASVLGDIKLNVLAKTLPVIAERHIHQPPCTWANYWKFQVAVGRVAQFIASYLELDYLGSTAYTGGLLHDIGKLVLWKLHPFGWHAIVRYARDRKLPLSDAERKYLGCTTRELAVQLADKQELPRVYVSVIRWVEMPALATQHLDVVAMVSLARHICMRAHVGCSGDASDGGLAALETTPAWSILQSRLFPSFDSKKFEAQAHAFCTRLQHELSGQLDEYRVPRPPARSAELV